MMRARRHATDLVRTAFPPFHTVFAAEFDPNLPIHPDILTALYPIVTSPSFDPTTVRKVSESVGGLCEWVRLVVVEKCRQLGWVDGVDQDGPVTPFTDARTPQPSELPSRKGKKGKQPEKLQPVLSDSSDEEEERHRPPPDVNEYIHLLRELQQEIISLKSSLNNQGIPTSTAQPALDADSADGDPGTSSHNPPRTQTVQLLQESVRLNGKQVIVKVAYEHSAQMVVVSAVDPVTDEAFTSTRIHALFVDQVTGCEPAELGEIPEAARRQKLRPLVDRVECESPGNVLAIQVERTVCRNRKTIDGVVNSYAISRTLDNDGVVITLERTPTPEDSSPEDPSVSPPRTLNSPALLSLHVADAELELLLAHQPGLYLRSQVSKRVNRRARCSCDAASHFPRASFSHVYGCTLQRKWTSQKAICDWLVTRILVVLANDDADDDYLTIDRSVPVPRNVEKGTTSTGANYTLVARQTGNEIILEAVPNADSEDASNASAGTPDFWADSSAAPSSPNKSLMSRPMSRVKIGLAEFQSLGAPENIPEQEEFPLPTASNPASPTHRRPLSSNALPGTADSATNIDLGRPARTPLDSLLSRLSWSIKNGQPVLGINRVVFQETIAVSGVPAIVRASVMNSDIIFQATRLQLKKNAPLLSPSHQPFSADDADEYEKIGEELVKLITEKEFALLLGDEPKSRVAFLILPANRQDLSRVLSKKLKMVKTSGQYRLETSLYRQQALLAIAIDSNHRDDVIGAVDIDDQTSLADLRALIQTEMDDEDLPISFRFRYQNAPCSKSQEHQRLASTLLPIGVLLTKKKRRRPNSAPHSVNSDSFSYQSDGDSEFGRPHHSHNDWDSDGSSKSSRSRRRKHRNHMRHNKPHHSDDDDALSDLNSELSDDFSSDDNGSKHSKKKKTKKSKKKKGDKKETKERRGRAKTVITLANGEKKVVDAPPPSADAKSVAKSEADTKSEPAGIDIPKKQPPKPKPVVKVPMPIPSLVTAMQGSPTLKTQVDCTLLLNRGDVVRVWRCTGGFAEWQISSDPKTPFDATTITLSKPYLHKCRIEEKAKPSVGDRLGGSTKKEDGDEGTKSSLSPRPNVTNSPLRRARGGIGVGTMNPAALPMNLMIGAAHAHQFDDDEDNENAVIEHGKELPGLQLWVMVLQKADKRPAWRKQYDDGMVPWVDEFTESEGFEKIFGVNMPWKDIENYVKDVFGDKSDCLHQQRLDNFERVTPGKIVQEAYGVLCRWHPISQNIDNSKWAKFSREMKLFPAKDASQVDLAFARATAGGKERKLNLKAFVACLSDIAVIRFPAFKDSPKEALIKLLLESVVMLPPVNRLAWKEAKRIAITTEATRICGAVRIASFHRRNVYRLYFLKKKDACIRTQTQIRRIISKNNLASVNQHLEYCRIFRVRHSSAVKAQKTFRMHYWRKKFLSHVQAQIDEEKRRVAEYRKKLNDNRKRHDASVVFKFVKVIQGLFTLIEFSRKDNRRQSTDYGIHCRVYLPSSQEMFKFSIEEDMMRELLEQAMEIDALSVQEMMLPSSLIHLTERFAVRETNGRPIILFSRRSTTERGLLVSKSSERVSNELFIVFVYRSADDFVFRAYDPRNCGQLRCLLSLKILREWLIEDHYRKVRTEEREYKSKLQEAQKVKQEASWGQTVDRDELRKANEFLRLHLEKEKEKERAGKEEEEVEEEGEGEKKVKSAEELKEEEEEEKGEDATALALVKGEIRDALEEPDEGLSVIEVAEPEMMKPENEEELTRWLLDRLKLSINRRTKKKRLILQYEEDDDIKDEMAVKLQGIWRCKKARAKCRHKCRQQFEKMWDKNAWCYYYLNKNTGGIQWQKPLVMGSEELDDPVDEWRELKNPEGGVYWQNPATGQTAYMSEDTAARLMQRLVRKHLSKDIPTPTMPEVVKALRFQRVAEDNYEKDPTKLANICNFALLCHCLTGDFVAARECYNKAVEKSKTNPVLLRAYGIFTLAANDSPRTKVFKAACDMFKAAKLSDPDLTKFEVAQHSFFQWAVISDPKNANALLNYALLFQCVLGDYDMAEKFYLRAIAVAPTNQNILDNFETLEKQRLPGGVYAGRGPSQVVLKRSEVSEEKVAWGEWQRMFDRKSLDPLFKHFWYNKLGRFTQFVEPKWEQEVWAVRLERSVAQGEEDSMGWVTYWDEKLRKTFYYNVLKKEYDWGPEEGEEGEGEEWGALAEAAEEWGEDSYYYNEEGGEGGGEEGLYLEAEGVVV